MRTGNRPEVALFVTCLVDMFRPNVGLAAVQLLARSGCEVVVPKHQTCCGQPAYNTGDDKVARRIAGQTIEILENYAHIVVPSGSCAGMLKEHYPKLFASEPDWSGRAKALAAKTYELTDFLVNVLGFDNVRAHYDGRVCYHDSCAGLRELGIKEQPRTLLKGVDGMSSVPLRDEEVCCGFGGLFCIKYPEVSGEMVGRKVKNIVASGADTLLAGDLGCLLNIAGKLTREGCNIRVWHVAEVLAGMTSGRAIGESEKRSAGN
ncbi:MAG TPA: (Fe-S)-binding protein [Gammaproteobacteria bacterium]